MATFSSSSNNNLQNLVICTSCGQKIHIVANGDEYYKCDQCACHYVCKNCSQLPMNKNSNHQLRKISPKIGKEQAQLSSTNSQSSSIFTNNSFLLSYLTYCDRCLNIIYLDKDLPYTCDQCPSFVACEKCIDFMAAQHPAYHTFSKSKKPSNVVGQHFGINCDGCREENMSDVRYQCEQCEKSYDLCFKCFRKAKKIHNQLHTFKFLQDPLIRSSNRQVLAQRALDWFARQKTPDCKQREPVTGWTKTDAEKIIQMESQFLEDYKHTKRQQDQIQRQIDEIKWHDEKQRQEHQNRLVQMHIDANQKSSEMWDDFFKRSLEMTLESDRRAIDTLRVAASPGYHRYYY